MPKRTPEQNKHSFLKPSTRFSTSAITRQQSDSGHQSTSNTARTKHQVATDLFALIRSAPQTLRYENQLIVAEGDYVMAHGRFSGIGRPAAWVAADVVRFEDGLLTEHWDVLQDEATQAESVSGLPMFGDRFPS